MVSAPAGALPPTLAISCAPPQGPPFFSKVQDLPRSCVMSSPKRDIRDPRLPIGHPLLLGGGDTLHPYPPGEQDHCGHWEPGPGRWVVLWGHSLSPPQVTDSSGHLLYSKEDAKKGKFAFTTDDYEIYEICFESHGQSGMRSHSWCRDSLSWGAFLPPHSSLPPSFAVSCTQHGQ